MAMRWVWAVQVLTPNDRRPGRSSDMRAKNRPSCDTEIVGPFDDIDAARAWVEGQGLKLVKTRPAKDEVIPDDVNRRRTKDGRYQVVEVKFNTPMTPPEV